METKSITISIRSLSFSSVCKAVIDQCEDSPQGPSCETLIGVEKVQWINHNKIALFSKTLKPCYPRQPRKQLNRDRMFGEFSILWPTLWHITDKYGAHSISFHRLFTTIKSVFMGSFRWKPPWDGPNQYTEMSK